MRYFIEKFQSLDTGFQASITAVLLLTVLTSVTEISGYHMSQNLMLFILLWCVSFAGLLIYNGRRNNTRY